MLTIQADTEHYPGFFCCGLFLSLVDHAQELGKWLHLSRTSKQLAVNHYTTDYSKVGYGLAALCDIILHGFPPPTMALNMSLVVLNKPVKNYVHI